MDEKERFLRWIPKIWEKARRWIIYVAVILFIVSYFAEILGPWREKVLVTAASAIVFVLFDILREISQSLKIKPESGSFLSLSEALPKIREIISRDKTKTSVKIIAATGGTTVATILPAIISSSPARKIEISIGILAPDTPYKEYIPPHWPGEIETTVERLKEFKSERVSVDLFLFEMLPVPHGLILNDEHLFLGFFGWTTIESGKSQLSGAQLPHYYYHKAHPKYEYYRDVFKSWIKHSPSRRTPKE